MDREYELFERRPDGSLTWRGVVQGLEQARVRVRLLASETDHECLAMYAPTREVIFRRGTDVLQSPSPRKRVFQIGYDEVQLAARERMLRRRGYGVTSAFGNEAAKAALRARPLVDLFVIGNGAPEATRLAMARWLHTTCPDIRILALNPPDCVRLDDVELNAPYDAPETWLPLVTAVTRPSAANAPAPRIF